LEIRNFFSAIVTMTPTAYVFACRHRDAPMAYIDHVREQYPAAEIILVAAASSEWERARKLADHAQMGDEPGIILPMV
jgi:hypothetical protein